MPRRAVNTGAPRFTPPALLPGSETGVDLAPSFSFGSEQTPESAISRALAARGRAQAQSEAAAKRKQAAIEFGEGPEGEANPFSVLKVLERNNRTGLENLENQLNSANLFFSGFRAKQLGDAATQFQQAQFDARNRFRGLLSDIDSALANRLLEFDFLDAQNAGGGGGGGFDFGGGGGVDQGVGQGGGQGNPGDGFVPAIDPNGIRPDQVRGVTIGGAAAIPSARVAAFQRLARAQAEAKLRAKALGLRANPAAVARGRAAALVARANTLSRTLPLRQKLLAQAAALARGRRR